MKKRIFIKNNHALAGVLEALLLIGLVAMILSTIQLYYIPDIMEQRESEHMDKVANQFSQLKSTVEIQSMMGVLQSDQAIAYSPISSPITLGSDKLSYFVTSWALGNVEIVDKSATESKIEILPAVSIPGVNDFDDGIHLTSIKYNSYNHYYLEGSSLSYILEGGGVVLKQSDGETMKVAPPIIAENNSNSINFIYSIPIFISKPSKNVSATMIDDTYIRTNYTRSYTHSEPDIEWIRINTEYINAWNQTLIADDSGILWEYYDNGYINVDPDNPSNPTRIEITPGTKEIDVEFTIVELGAQIGPGVVN